MNGITSVLLSCALNVVVSITFYHAKLIDPDFSPHIGILIRVVMNLLVILPLLKWDHTPLAQKKYLLLWGFFGLLTSVSYFRSIFLIGGGLTSFLNAGSGLVISLAAPFLLKEKNSLKIWLGIFFNTLGLFLMIRGSIASFSPLGLILASASGVFAALAYLTIAKSLRGTPTSKIMFYWSMANLFVLVPYTLFHENHWPSNYALVLLLIGGISASYSQYFISIAYQMAPANLVSCLSYLGPMMSLAADSILFGLPFGEMAILGCILITIFGGIIPLWGVKQKHPT